MTNFDITTLTYILMSLDKSSHASCKIQKFAQALEKRADFSKLSKSKGTSLQNDSLDTCTRTALMSGFLSRGNSQMAEKKEERRKISRIALATEKICFANRRGTQTLALY